MKAPYVVAIIDKDAVQKLPKVVPLHEVAVLLAVHGQGSVYVDEEADLPTNHPTEVEFDPDEEFARLEQHYGGPVRGEPPSFAAMAYEGHNGFVRKCEEYENSPRKVKKAKKLAKVEEPAELHPKEFHPDQQHLGPKA